LHPKKFLAPQYSFKLNWLANGNFYRELKAKPLAIAGRQLPRMDQSHPKSLKASAAGMQSKAEATTAVLARASPKGERKLLVICHIFSSPFFPAPGRGLAN
jgi:hypothetical protein